MDRNWMYDRYYNGKRGELKEIFKLGVALFLKAAKRSNIIISSSSSSAPIVPAQNYQHYPFNEMNHMITDALGIGVANNDEYDGDQLPNADAQRFFNLLKDTNEPLFEDSTDTKLTVCVRLLGLKCNYPIPTTASVKAKTWSEENSLLHQWLSGELRHPSDGLAWKHFDQVNSGVCMKSVTENGKGDFYGVIEDIFEIEYNYLDNKNTVVLFYCSWFDPSSRGTKFNSKRNTVDIQMTRRYELFDPFAIANNVTQVYYVPYPSTRVDKRGWCATIMTKPRGRIEKDRRDEDVDHPYQIDEMTNVADDVIAVEPFNQLCVGKDEAEEVPPGGDVDEDDEVPLEDVYMTSLAASGEPPLPPSGGGGDLGGHGSDPPGAGRGRGRKKVPPRNLKCRTVYNREATPMPRKVNEDGTEIPIEPDPEEETRVDDEIREIDLLAPSDTILVDRHNRPVIMRYFDDFQPQKAASTHISSLVQGNYNEPFVSWKDVKNDKNAWDRFWNDFRVICTWLKKFDASMIKVFNKKCSKRLSALLSNVRCSDSKPAWIGDKFWPILKDKWVQEEYKEKCRKAATNRDSENRGGCSHRGGQTSRATFRAECFALNGCEPTMCQMHEFFHKRPDGSWDTNEAARVQREMDEFEEAFNAQQNVIPPSERAPEDVRETIMIDHFVEVAGGMPKIVLGVPAMHLQW
ncbi:hypothetical protein TSUD_375750 [Trifolium subterraneum]|uniref:DUF4216 domain-containing protein n=1 Tax=Trifolium subterraneum TaxID=3900 RepID=A0A2Z6LZX3_TRISU|nr:hypothetical protein TSUD_375750 [Trifolium subterraneum]